MNSESNQTDSKMRRWVGIVVSTVPILFLAFDGVIKLARIQPVLDSFAQMGVPDHLAVGIGILELTCLALYTLPRTSVLGAVMLTGFLGGAISLKVRIDDPLFSHTLFPVYVGLFLWGGLFLRENRLGRIFPVRTGGNA